MRYIIENTKNNIDFFLRNYFAFSRKNYFEKSEYKKNVLNEIQNEIFLELNSKYNLDILKNTTVINFLENLYFLNVFDKYFSKKFFSSFSFFDVGSKNWSYAKSEYIFAHSLSNNVKLSGIEIDANRLNREFYSREEIAKFHIKTLENTEYIADDFLNFKLQQDYIVWILPFISEYPHIKWGLPLKYFSPLKMLQHAYNLLKEGGELLIINQGEKEYEIQQKMLENLGYRYELFGEISNDFQLYKNKRYCLKIYKTE